MDTSTTPVPAVPTGSGPRPTCELEPTCTEHVSGDVFIYECSACGKSCDRVPDKSRTRLIEAYHAPGDPYHTGRTRSAAFLLFQIMRRMAGRQGLAAS